MGCLEPTRSSSTAESERKQRRHLGHEGHRRRKPHRRRRRQRDGVALCRHCHQTSLGLSHHRSSSVAPQPRHDHPDHIREDVPDREAPGPLSSCPKCCRPIARGSHSGNHGMGRSFGRRPTRRIDRRYGFESANLHSSSWARRSGASRLAAGLIENDDIKSALCGVPEAQLEGPQHLREAVWVHRRGDQRARPVDLAGLPLRSPHPGPHRLCPLRRRDLRDGRLRQSCPGTRTRVPLGPQCDHHEVQVPRAAPLAHAQVHQEAGRMATRGRRNRLQDAHGGVVWLAARDLIRADRWSFKTRETCGADLVVAEMVRETESADWNGAVAFQPPHHEFQRYRPPWGDRGPGAGPLRHHIATEAVRPDRVQASTPDRQVCCQPPNCGAGASFSFWESTMWDPPLLIWASARDICAPSSLRLYGD